MYISPEIQGLTNDELFDTATDESGDWSTRVQAQDELSRRAHYNKDSEALRLLVHGRDSTDEGSLHLQTRKEGES